MDDGKQHQEAPEEGYPQGGHGEWRVLGDLRITRIRASRQLGPCDPMDVPDATIPALTMGSVWWTGDACAARTSPRELLCLRRDDDGDRVPGGQAGAMSVHVVSLDASDGLMVIELLSGNIESWLSGYVDICSIPPKGGCSRARFQDVCVAMIRPEKDRLWLVADYSLGEYLQDHLLLLRRKTETS